MTDLVFTKSLFFVQLAPRGVTASPYNRSSSSNRAVAVAACITCSDCEMVLRSFFPASLFKILMTGLIQLAACL